MTAGDVVQVPAPVRLIPGIAQGDFAGYLHSPKLLLYAPGDFCFSLPLDLGRPEPVSLRGLEELIEAGEPAGDCELQSSTSLTTYLMLAGLHLFSRVALASALPRSLVTNTRYRLNPWTQITRHLLAIASLPNDKLLELTLCLWWVATIA